jgi:hypothetical protein
MAGRHAVKAVLSMTGFFFDPDEVHMTSRSCKGYWRMSHNRIVQQALSNQRLKEKECPC